MMMIKTTILAAVAALSLASASSATVVHNDGATNFNGVYNGVGTVDYTFAATGGSNDISFTLFGANSVDGFGNGYDDFFSIALNGLEVFKGYFNMSGGGINNVVKNDLGWVVKTITNGTGLFEGGTTTIKGLANLLNGDNVFSVSFTSEGQFNGSNQGTNDESWALNNLDVTPAAVPLPAAMPLLLAGLAGLGLVGVRRRKSSV